MTPSLFLGTHCHHSFEDGLVILQSSPLSGMGRSVWAQLLKPNDYCQEVGFSSLLHKVHPQFHYLVSFSTFLALLSTCLFLRGSRPRPFPAARIQSTRRLLSLIPELQTPGKTRTLCSLAAFHAELLRKSQESHQGGLSSQEQPGSFPTHHTLTSHHLLRFLALSCL